MQPHNVPGSVDFKDPAQARAWVKDTTKKRSERQHFFDHCVEALNGRYDVPYRLLDLGSGPGHLAEAILRHTPVSSYVALDFSEAMHVIARERLAPFGDKVRYVQRDFRDSSWDDGLGEFGAVVVMQAAHETRDKTLLVPFLKKARAHLAGNGLFLYCDYYVTKDNGVEAEFFLERDAQEEALHDAGFRHIERLFDESGMALYSSLSVS